MITCTQCKSEIAGQNKFCTQCGAKAPEHTAVAASSELHLVIQNVLYMFIAALLLVLVIQGA